MSIDDALRALVRDVVRAELAATGHRAAPADSGDRMPAPVAARKRGVSPDFVARLCREGKVPALRAGRRWLVRLADLDAALTPRNGGGAEVVDLEQRAREILARRRRAGAGAG